MFDETPIGDVPVPDASSLDQPESHAATAAAVPASVHDDSDDDMGDHFGAGPASPMGGMSSDGSRPASPGVDAATAGGRVSVASRRFTPAPQLASDEHALDGPEEQPAIEQTTLVHDEEESFALAPVDASALKGVCLNFINIIFS